MRYHVINNNSVYLLKDNQDNIIAQGRSIGINNINDLSFSDSFSSYDQVINDYDRIYIGNSLAEQRMITIGNIDEIYPLLKTIISKNKDRNFVEVCDSVLETVNQYFGSLACISDRLDYFPVEQKVSTGIVARGKISSIKGKSVALGEERAILSQNLLKSLGYDSILKFSIVKEKDEHNEYEFVHAYNLIQHDNKYYLFDATFPTINNGRMSPIIEELDQETFEALAYPLNNNKDILKTSVSVSHFDPLRIQFIEMIYNNYMENKKVKERIKGEHERLQ